MKPNLMKSLVAYIGRDPSPKLGKTKSMKKEIGGLPDDELKKIIYSPTYRLPGESDELYKTRRYMKKAAQEILKARKVSISRKK